MSILPQSHSCGVTPIENQHRHIAGFRDFPQETVDKINLIKHHEQIVTGLLEDVARDVGRMYNSNAARHLSIARTELETGFMYLIKAVAQSTNGLANANLFGLPPRVNPNDSGQSQTTSSHGIGINNPGV